MGRYIYLSAAYPRLQDYWGNQARIRGLLRVGTQGTPTKTEKSADLTHYSSGVATLCVKKVNIELENVSPELTFYWGNSPVNLNVQNHGGEVPLFPSRGYAYAP